MMSQFLALGLSLQDVVRLCTVEPAKAIRREDALGHLAVGRVADLTVLEVVDGEWVYRDRDGGTLVGPKALVPLVTIRAGEIVTLDWGPHPWGWLPEPGGHARHTPGERGEETVST